MVSAPINTGKPLPMLPASETPIPAPLWRLVGSPLLTVLDVLESHVSVSIEGMDGQSREMNLPVNIVLRKHALGEALISWMCTLQIILEKE
jgi:hypothetical protein